jgi:cytoskeleton protein RodZ
VSRHGRRHSRSRHSHQSDRAPRVSTVSRQPDEPEEEIGASPGLAMALATDGCFDDRPSSPPYDNRSARTSSELPGLRLQRHREERGLSIDDLWRTTKINRATLRALEATDVQHLPAAIYTRGFVKAYAGEVGLDPDTTADDYLNRIEPLRTPPASADDASAHAQAAIPVDANDDARNLMAINQARRFSRLAVLAAGVGLVVYLTSFSRQADQPATTAADYGDVNAASDVARAGLDRELPTAPVGMAVGEPLRLELVPQAPCWLSARVDGERVVAKLLQPGDRQTLDISDEAVLRVGEPGALSLSINGQSGRPLGPAGQPITVRITRDNYRDFLSS